MDDPFWDEWMPPNGWGCKCGVRQITETEAERRGGVSRAQSIARETWTNPRSGVTESIPRGIDPGWNTNPGRDRLAPLTPPHLSRPTLPQSFTGASSGGTQKPPMPPPRQWQGLGPAKIPPAKSDQAAVDDFLLRFGAKPGQTVLFTDKTGTPILIGPGLFTDRRTGGLKSRKFGRDQYLPILAETIRNPDEIWLRWEVMAKKQRLKRSYIARFVTPEGKIGGLGIFHLTRDGWQGTTLFPPATFDLSQVDSYLDQQREGLLLYRRQ